MTELLGTLGTVLDLLLVVLGFSLIVFFHELGHFIAAKWAGIRVLAFAIGFGPAILSYRRGLGLRRGSSEPEYHRLLEREGAGSGDAASLRGVSPTEYRLNWLPLGGYVKMLGQEDLNPAATSAASDSYQNCPPWKRMVVISAGVVMNVIVAAVLFIAVFMVGLKTEPPIIGEVFPGTPAAKAVPIGAEAVPAGLRPGDVVTAIDGDRPDSFNDLVLAAAMADPNRPLVVEVDRPGEGRLAFEVTPEKDPTTRLLEIGVFPARAPELLDAATPRDAEDFRAMMARLGLEGVEPGMRLVRAGDDDQITTAQELEEAIERSGGRPVPVVFASDEARVEAMLEPLPELEADFIERAAGTLVVHQHLLGLTPVMRVEEAQPRAVEQGLRDGDVFARLGSVEYPSLAQGITEIRRHAGGTIPAIARRAGPDGRPREVALELSVSAQGTIGFLASDTGDNSTLLALPPERLVRDRVGGEAYRPAAAGLITRPGTRIVRVAGTPVANFAELRAALREATADALESGAASAEAPLVVEWPLPEQPGGRAPTQTLRWMLDRDDLERLHALGWRSPVPASLFKPRQVPLKAENPIDAVRMGLEETHRVMMTTYLTFVRLFQGSVHVEHLKGPVGIAELGTRIAGRGYIWLLFFLALVSVNLAVINFLPMPIVDGGQFLFLVLEQIRGRPVPVAVQNAATFVGLLLIGAVFLIVTFNDLANLLGG